MALVLIGVPLGNVEDLSIRARNSLENVDVLLCEDTRNTFKLLSACGIKNKPLLESFYEEVEEQKIAKVIAWIKSGKTVGLVSDAGLPIIADPGWRLVQRVWQEKLPIKTVPGPSAFLSALLLSGFPADRFLFLGFLSKNSNKRERSLRQAKLLKPITIIFYESAKRLIRLLTDLERIDKKSLVTVCWELTKRYESVIRGDITVVKKQILTKINRGEVTVVWRIS